MKPAAMTCEPHRRKCCRAWGLILAGIFLAGCGQEVYEKRLENTKMMFAHQELLNNNLQAPWGDAESGVSLRPPMQFLMLAPPSPTAAEPQGAQAPQMQEGEEAAEEEVIDNRQPAYMNLGLPGLRGAFTAPMKVHGENNATVDGEGFLYVMTNQHLAEQPDAAKTFDQDFATTLAEALGLEFEMSDWKENERFPTEGRAKASFVKSLSYRNITFISPEQISGYVREFATYVYEQDGVKVIVLWVLPRDVDTGEKLLERVPLALETLVVAGKLTVPSAATAPAAGGGTGPSF